MPRHRLPPAAGLPIAPTQAAGQALAAVRQAVADALQWVSAAQCPVMVGPVGDLSQPGPGHFHLVPELFVQRTGQTHFQISGQTLSLQPGQVLVLPPRVLHAEQVCDGPTGEAFSNLVLQADGDRLSCHLARQVAPGEPGIQHLAAWSHPQVHRIRAWLADAAATHLHKGPAQAPWAAEQARALVCATLAGTLGALQALPDAGPAEPPLVSRLRVLVQNQLGDQALSVRLLAAQSGCTADHLSHVFARSTGEHLVAYINRLRLARAARLLQDTTMAAKQVAWACGYASQSYFSQAFNQHHGMTPTAWRAARQQLAP